MPAALYILLSVVVVVINITINNNNNHHQQLTWLHLNSEFLQCILYQFRNAGAFHHRQMSVSNVSLR